MKTFRKIKPYLIFPLGMIAITLMSLSEAMQQRSPWIAPAGADTIKNPLKGNVTAIEAGKKVYAMYCVVCHGEKGKGNGVAASNLNPRPADHSSERVQKQTDGALYWKLSAGRPPMASYAKTLTTQQRWQVVDYIRTLKAEK